MPIKTSVQLLKHRRTKIVATLGPASSDAQTIGRLIDAGANVFRLNMSHGDHAGHREIHQRVRAEAQRAGRHVAILGDLAGPKIRVGVFRDGGIDLEEGSTVRVTTREETGEPGLIPSQYDALARDVRAGDRILLADGNFELRVIETDGIDLRCTVVSGGRLTDRKGINLPGVAVSAPSLTAKDREDARFLLDLGVEYVALSFVRRGTDLRDLKELIRNANAHAQVIAKIEKPEALADADAILATADGIMVARGDLGVELPAEQVPVAQQQLVDQARRLNRPVIVATQMLESMIVTPRPTRAEVADVSHAVASGADAVMLSGETASGAHPVRAVEMMDRIARQTEGYLWDQGAFERLQESADLVPPLPFGDALARSTSQLSRDLMVRAIVVASESGRSAATVSAARPAAPVLAVSSRVETCRRLSLNWGIIPVAVRPEELAEPYPMARRLAKSMGLAAAGQFILMVSGFHRDPALSTPNVTVLTV